MSVLDNVKEVVSLVQKVDNIELYRQILALQGEIIGVVEENLGLREKVKDLESRLAIRETLEFDDDHYWVRRLGGREGPYCQTCWDIDGKLVREVRGATEGTFFCQYCVSGARKAGHR